MTEFKTSIYAHAEDLEATEMQIWRLINAKVVALTSALALHHTDSEGGELRKELQLFQPPSQDEATLNAFPAFAEIYVQVKKLARIVAAWPSDGAPEDQKRNLDEDIAAMLPLELVLGGDGKTMGVRRRGGVNAPTALEVVKPVPRGAAQDSAILKAISELGHDPIRLPSNPPGKPGVKASVRGALKGNALFVGNSVFDKAWERLTASREIVIVD
jgi:hypothetical protein